jgi:hypothetical protein
MGPHGARNQERLLARTSSNLIDWSLLYWIQMRIRLLNYIFMFYLDQVQEINK